MKLEYQDEYEDEYEVATQVVGMAGLFLLLLLAGTAGAWIWSCRCLQLSCWLAIIGWLVTIGWLE